MSTFMLLESTHKQTKKERSVFYAVSVNCLYRYRVRVRAWQ